jgi:hypothetical protein
VLTRLGFCGLISNSLFTSVLRDIVFHVKTLPEIEAAVESLPPAKQEELLRFIEARLRNLAAAPSHALGRSKRNFPVSKGRIPFTSADVARIELDSDATS